MRAGRLCLQSRKEGTTKGWRAGREIRAASSAGFSRTRVALESRGRGNRRCGGEGAKDRKRDVPLALEKQRERKLRGSCLCCWPGTLCWIKMLALLFGRGGQKQEVPVGWSVVGRHWSSVSRRGTRRSFREISIVSNTRLQKKSTAPRRQERRERCFREQRSRMIPPWMERSMHTGHMRSAQAVSGGAPMSWHGRQHRPICAARPPLASAMSPLITYSYKSACASTLHWPLP